MMLRVATVVALAGAAFAGSGRCPAVTGRGDLTVSSCNCAATMRVPLGSPFASCEPCTGGKVAGETFKVKKVTSKTYSVETYSYGKRTGTQKVECGLCFNPYRSSYRKLSIACPPSPSGKCPAKTGNGEATFKTCGKATCSARWRVPVGEKFDYCDPCTFGTNTGVTMILEKDGDDKYQVTQTSYGKTDKGTFSCGECVNGIELDCTSPAKLSGVMIAVIVGGVLCCCLGAAAFVLMRRKSQAASASASASADQYHNYTDGSHSAHASPMKPMPM